MHLFELQELEEATDGFSPSRLIGKGSHGSVYRGILHNGDIVAVKKQSLGLEKLQDNSKLENEALILSSIPPNPCIINLLGISHDNTILVTEYMSNGTLHHLLHQISATPPPWRKRAEIALDLARALCYLHGSNPPVVHRDVKSANILFHENWNVKLADFGLAMRLHSEVESKQLPAGTMGYIDPNYTTPGQLSTNIDVFSYGVVLLELVSGRKAIDVSQSPASIVEWAIPLIGAGRAMEICDKRVAFSVCTRRVLGELLDVASRCVSCDRRPSMKEVVVELERLIVEPIDRSPWSMNYVREMVVSMMRGKKWKLISGECKERDDIIDRESGVGCNNISKGRLLIREILADITLK